MKRLGNRCLVQVGDRGFQGQRGQGLRKGLSRLSDLEQLSPVVDCGQLDGFPSWPFRLWMAGVAAVFGRCLGGASLLSGPLGWGAETPEGAALVSPRPLHTAIVCHSRQGGLRGSEVLHVWLPARTLTEAERRPVTSCTASAAPYQSQEVHSLAERQERRLEGRGYRKAWLLRDPPKM